MSMRRSRFAGMTGDEIFPGKDIKSDAEIDNYIRSTAITMYHPTSTCAMGVSPDAVVDGELRVNGVSKVCGCRCVGDAERAGRTYQCADDHDRREGGGYDARPRRAGADRGVSVDGRVPTMPWRAAHFK